MLADGTIRLLSVTWLRSTPEGTVLRRRQDLPDEAFLTPAQARSTYASGHRRVAVLSYRWLTKAHPDPAGQRLDTLRTCLEANALKVDLPGALFLHFFPHVSLTLGPRYGRWTASSGTSPRCRRRRGARRAPSAPRLTPRRSAAASR